MVAVLIVFLAQLHKVLLLQLLVFADKFRQFVSDGDVQLVDGTALEIRAGFRELFELVQRVQTEEVEVDLWVGQVVARDVGEGRQAFVDVVVLRMLDDLVRDVLFVAKQAFLVVVGCEIAVNHLSVIADTHLKK